MHAQDAVRAGRSAAAIMAPGASVWRRVTHLFRSSSGSRAAWVAIHRAAVRGDHGSERPPARVGWPGHGPEEPAHVPHGGGEGLVLARGGAARDLAAGRLAPDPLARAAAGAPPAG